MLRKWLFTAVALLILANIGLFAMSPASAAAGAQDPEPWGTCGCVNGSDPEGPGGPYEAECISWLYDECSSSSQCSCSGDGEPVQPGGGG